MKKYIFLIFCFCIGLLLMLLPQAFAYTSSMSDKDTIVNRELDCVSQNFDEAANVDWNDLCYVESRTYKEDDRHDTINSALDQVEAIHAISQAKNDYTPNLDEARPEINRDYENLVSSSKSPYKGFFSRRNPLKKIELGFETFPIIYEEPGIMKQTGYMNGVYGGYTYRTKTNDNIKTLNDIFSTANNINMFRGELRMNFGQVDYESQGTGTINSVDDYMIEARGLLGMDIPAYKASRVTPYTGVGYRYLNDNMGFRTTSTGALGYKRENKCYYMPIGFETNTNLTSDWTIGLNLEYNFFLGGQQISHLEDTGSWLYDADSDTYHTPDALKHEQYHGFGLRSSVKAVKKTEPVDFFVQPFVNFWKKEKSNQTQISSDDGGLYWYNTDGAGNVLLDSPLWTWEPENKTTEYGIKLGLMF